MMITAQFEKYFILHHPFILLNKICQNTLLNCNHNTKKDKTKLVDFKNNTIDIIIRYILLSLSLLYILDNFTFYLVYHLILILTLLIQKKFSIS